MKFLKYPMLTLLILLNFKAFCVEAGEYTCLEFDQKKRVYGDEIGVVEVVKDGLIVFNDYFPFSDGAFLPFPYREKRGFYSLEKENMDLIYRFTESGLIDEVVFSPIYQSEIQVKIKENGTQVDQFRCRKLNLFLF